MSKMNKTHVSVLQEMMVKKGKSPSYELVVDGGGTHQNFFVYQVACDGLVATGSGRCKKDAKHEAAKNMLSTIASQNAFPQLPASPCDSPVRTPLPVTLPVCPKSPANVPFRNTIGELQELCSLNNLDNPIYKETGDVGPPHARVFTAQCKVSSFIEEGTASTKKQAKHEAARKMLDRLMGVLSDDQIEIIDEYQKKEHAANKLAIARYPELSNNIECNKSKINWGLKVKDFYKRFKKDFDEEKQKELMQELNNICTLIESHKNNLCEENETQVKDAFESTLKSADIKFSYNDVENIPDQQVFIKGIRLYTAPDIYELGYASNEKEAVNKAIENVVTSMIFLLR